MLQSVYLDREIVDVLKCFGTLEEVVNRILEAGEQGFIDLANKPNPGTRNGSSRFTIDVKNDYYLNEMYEYGVHSPKYSLRRILYWFVEEEIYNELGWKASEKYINTYREKFIKKLNLVKSEIKRLIHHNGIKSDEIELLTGVLIELGEIR